MILMCVCVCDEQVVSAWLNVFVMDMNFVIAIFFFLKTFRAAVFIHLKSLQPVLSCVN